MLNLLGVSTKVEYSLTNIMSSELNRATTTTRESTEFVSDTALTLANTVSSNNGGSNDGDMSIEARIQRAIANGNRTSGDIALATSNCGEAYARKVLAEMTDDGLVARERNSSGHGYVYSLPWSDTEDVTRIRVYVVIVDS